MINLDIKCTSERGLEMWRAFVEYADGTQKEVLRWSYEGIKSWVDSELARINYGARNG